MEEIALYKYQVGTILERNDYYTYENIFSDILENIKDMEPEFSKTVDENFWNII